SRVNCYEPQGACMTNQIKNSARLSRRELIKGGLGAGAVIAGRGIFAASPQSAAANPGQGRVDGDLVLMNGKFVDGGGLVASALTIKNGRIVNLGQGIPPGPGAQMIDLGGRTVIPGLFDAHVHYTRAGINP